MNKIIKKIPGALPPVPKTEIDGKINDLSTKTIPELCELRDRQLKLLNNKSFISKLTDKGAKIQAFYDRILTELNCREDVGKTCEILSKLNLHNQTVQQVEWVGKLETKEDVYLDSDDDSEPEDVMHILSQSTAQEKHLKIIEPDKPLVSPEDLINIGEIPHVKYIVNKTEVQPKLKPTGQFKPYKTTKTDVHNPKKEVLRKKHKYWEVTAATPPPSVHGPAKVLPIEESLKLQKEYNAHLKEIEAQHAAEKLLARTGIKMAVLPVNPDTFGRYRENSDDSDSDSEGSDKEVHDEEPERGGVVFTVMK